MSVSAHHDINLGGLVDLMPSRPTVGIIHIRSQMGGWQALHDDYVLQQHQPITMFRGASPPWSTGVMAVGYNPFD